MAITLLENKTYEGCERDGIGANSVDTSSADKFVSVSGEFIATATSSTKIAGVSLTRKVYASDNQTVAKARLSYIPNDIRNLYGVTITGGTITVSDEGKYYNLSDAVTVDGTTETTTPYYTNTGDSGGAVDPLIAMQLKLVKFISATYSIFEINTLI